MSIDYIHNHKKVNIKQIGKTKKTQKRQVKIGEHYNYKNCILPLKFPATKQ